MNKVAIHIKTDLWNHIIDTLKKRGWIVTSKYYGFDAGIDHDYLVMRKGLKKISFGWSNWFEGEITCSDELFHYIELEMDTSFEYGEPNSLKQSFSFWRRIQNIFKK